MMRIHTTRHSAMTEYIIVTGLIISCSVAMYFSVLLTGAQGLGMQVCGECPKKDTVANTDPLPNNGQPGDEPGENGEPRDPNAEPAPVEPGGSSTSSGDNINNQINNEYWSYVWSNWFRWLYF